MEGHISPQIYLAESAFGARRHKGLPQEGHSIWTQQWASSKGCSIPDK